VIEQIGRHPIGMIDHEYERFAPRDWVNRGEGQRDLEQLARMIGDLTRALEMRIELAATMYERASYDLFVDVVAETHCAGHQLWSLHDRTHPDHDPATVAALGGDPLLPIYRLVDELVGLHLDRIGPDGVAYVVASHGMRNHFDGTLLLDEILWRLDQRYGGFPTPWIGQRTSRIDRLSRVTRGRPSTVLGTITQRTLGRRPAIPTPPSDIPGPAGRLWYPLENNTVCGAVRFNRVGREPQGKLDDALLEHAAGWLADELRAIVNVDTGAPAISDAYLTDLHFVRDLEDGLPDLIVEWNHQGRFDRVWSPSIGTICRPYDGLRTGDHAPDGEVYVIGAGVNSGDQGRIAGADLAPTIAAAMSVDLPNSTGVVAERLVPGPHHHAEPAPSQRWPDGTMPRTAATDDHLEVRALRRSLIALRTELSGLSAAHHETRMLAESARHRADVTADIIVTTSWIAEQTVGDHLIVSVIIPTRNRSERVRDAIRSVLEQSYPNLEVIVVDDGSTDDTMAVLEAISDPRVRRHRNDVSVGEGATRNAALDLARGDIVCFLDDDNTFDRNWVRSVVWLFETHTDTDIAYGARLVDDHRRHHDHIAGGLPHVELHEWDDDVLAERSIVDVNVLAHRRCDVRFQVDLPLFTDWAYLQELSTSSRPLRLPVIAARYTTDCADRATFVFRPLHDTLYERVRSQVSARRVATRTATQGDDGPGVHATNA
jgi:hypothetical protein